MRASARAEKERGFSRGLERLALTPLELLSLVTLFRNTKESYAHPGRGKYYYLKELARRANGKKGLFL